MYACQETNHLVFIWIHLQIDAMSLSADHKLLLGAVGIAVTSAVAGFTISRIFQRRNLSLYKISEEDNPVAKYVTEYGIREPSALASLRKVRIFRIT